MLPYPAIIAIKALPIILLLFWGLSALSGKLRIGVTAALIASAAGDVFLAMRADLFIPGLASFLVAQLIYAFIFWSRRKTDQHRKWLVVGFIPLVLIVGSIVLPASEELLIPVTAYLVAISLMVIGAALSDRPWQWVYMGAFIFAISDSLIAINKFVIPISNAELWIMLFYYLAQYLMVSGIIRGEKRRAVPRNEL
ncbi:hypothetical protein ACH42_12330 [Endozoicomonas sp. (ex Bugula neritina AB1)]|nr:hypothetical protein ACH42_12330 [Endozoicomonas sp. (ex Bugula neritina AB1)]